MDVFIPVHHIKCKLIIVIDLIARGYIQKHEGKCSICFFCEYVIRDGAIGSNWFIITYASIQFIIIIATVQHARNSSGILELKDRKRTAKACPVKSIFQEFFQVGKAKTDGSFK